MDWLEILYQILEVCVIPLLGILTTFLVKWLRAKELEVLDKIDSETADKYIAMLFDTIAACVSTTTETYVKALKAEGKFDAEAQKIAFNKTYEAIIKGHKIAGRRRRKRICLFGIHSETIL